MTTKSASNLSLCCSSTLYKFSLPISSSPSIQSFTFNGNVSSVFMKASSTARCIKTYLYRHLHLLHTIVHLLFPVQMEHFPKLRVDLLAVHHNARKLVQSAHLYLPYYTRQK